jgi:hypothetical protein
MVGSSFFQSAFAHSFRSDFLAIVMAAQNSACEHPA